MWKTLTVSAVQSRLADAELDAMRESALADGQADPLDEVITRTITEIRGLLGVNHTLGSGDTIPDELEGAALALVRYRLITRLPDVGLMTEDRRQEYRDAQSLIKTAAKADGFVFEAPETATNETLQKSNCGSTLAGSTTRKATRNSLRGL